MPEPMTIDDLISKLESIGIQSGKHTQVFVAMDGSYSDGIRIEPMTLNSGREDEQTAAVIIGKDK